MTEKTHLAKFFSRLVYMVLTLTAATSAWAAEVLVVENVPLYAESIDLSNAKSEAINHGTEASFTILLQRLLPVEKYWHIPSFSSNAFKAVSDIAIADERMTAFSYTATGTYRYDPSKLKSLLNKAGIFYLDAYSPPQLIIPVLQKGDQLFIWEDEQWADAWGNMPSYFGLLKLNYLMGDLTDESTLDPLKALSAKFSYFAPLLKRYNAQEVIIALAQSKENGVTLKLRHLSKELDHSKTVEISRPHLTFSPELYSVIAQETLRLMDSYYKHYNSFDEVR